MFKKRYRLVVALLLFIVGALNYLDRSALSVAAPMMKHELHLDDSQMGILFSCFFIGYCVFCFIGGWAADRMGPRKVFAWAAGLWSLFCGATAFVGGFSQLLVIRIIFGIGEGPMGTTTNKSISNWFPRSEVGRAVGFTNAGQPLGAALAAPVVGFTALYFGWRVSFIIIALLGLIWVASWLYWFRDKPEQHPLVSKEEAEIIAAKRPAETVNLTPKEEHPASIWHYVFSRSVLGVALVFFSFNYIQFFFLSWLPSYFTDYQHLNIKTMSIVSILPWLGATIGFLGGGIVCDMIYRRTRNFLLSRKVVIFIGLTVAAICVMLTAVSQTITMAVTLITLASIFAYVTPQACWSLLQEIVPAKRIGSTGGFVHLLANLAGILSPALTGYLIQYGGGYKSAFILASSVAIFGILVLLCMVRNTSSSRASRQRVREAMKQQ